MVNLYQILLLLIIVFLTMGLVSDKDRQNRVLFSLVLCITILSLTAILIFT